MKTSVFSTHCLGMAGMGVALQPEAGKCNMTSDGRLLTAPSCPSYPQTEERTVRTACPDPMPHHVQTVVLLPSHRKGGSWYMLWAAACSTQWRIINLDTAMSSCGQYAQLLRFGHENLSAANSELAADWCSRDRLDMWHSVCWIHSDAY